MNRQLNPLVTAAGTALALLALTFTAAAASPEVSAAARAGRVSQRPLVYAPPAAACTKLAVTKDVYWVNLDDSGAISQTVDGYPPATITITAAFDYTCIPSRTKLTIVWYALDQQWGTFNQSLRSDAQPGTYSQSVTRRDLHPLDPGDYGVEFYLGQTPITSGTVAVGAVDHGPPPVTQTVAVQGSVVDSSSKKPISGAVVIVLNPDVDITNWLLFGSDADRLASAKTDSKGQFALDNRVSVDVGYPWLIGAKGYQSIADPVFTITQQMATDPYVMTITLVRSK